MSNGKVDNKAFEMMTTAVDKTDVSINKPKEKIRTSKSIHTALMAAGMTPGLGNIADVADAALYAFEGEFGEAAWSSAAAVPFLGQMVAGRRAAKATKEAGERMFTVYRTAAKWYPGKMVREGKFTGKAGNEIFTSLRKDVVEDYRSALRSINQTDKLNFKYGWEKGKNPIMLEFELPESWLRKNSKEILKEGWDRGTMHEFHTNPIPKEFLKKVHK